MNGSRVLTGNRRKARGQRPPTRLFLVASAGLPFVLAAVFVLPMILDREARELPPPPAVTATLISLPQDPLPLEPPPAAEETRAARAEETPAPSREGLSRELGKLWTREPEQLVDVVEWAKASSDSEYLPPLTLSLAIAHAETNGRILTVSEAGAVGLAQATPLAWLQEGLSGRLFVTPEYAEGTRAYFLKKPLDDADRVATLMLNKPYGSARDEALALLEASFKVRREGVEDLSFLGPFADPGFPRRVREADVHNRMILEQLEHLIRSGASEVEMRTFRDDARREYRALRDLQRQAWTQYQNDLMRRRDRILEQTYGSPKKAAKDHLYQAAELLGEQLDARFSARRTALFLQRHLGTKLDEARELGVPQEKLAETTVGLYNGGSQNMKRMMSGLITNLPETEKYMKKVLTVQKRLDSADTNPPPAPETKAAKKPPAKKSRRKS